jgi:excinuclease ABC subunit C
VGPNRRKALLRHFGSLKKIKAATASELGEVGGVSTVLARVIEDFFNAKG